MSKGKGSLIYVIVAIVTFACVGLTGCVDDVKNIYKEEEPEKPNDFDFSTKKNVEFTLKYDVSAGYKVHFEMYTKSPLTLDEYKSYVKDTTLIPFFSGRSEAGGKISFKGELSASTDEIYAYSSAIGVPVLMKATVSAEGIVSEFKTTEVQAARSARANEGGPSKTSSWTTYSVKLNRPTLTTEYRKIQDIDKNLIDQLLKNNQTYVIDKTYYQPSLKLIDKAKVRIYSVSHGQDSERTNALAYFVYNKDDESVKPEDINSNLSLVFPKLTRLEPTEGEGYKLLNGTTDIFEAGSRIGFALFPNVGDNINTTDTHVLYSCFNPGSWNTYTYPVGGSDRGMTRAGVPHMVMSLLREDSDGHAIIAIGFEDQPWDANYGTNRGNFRDDIFIIEVDPAASVPGDLPKPPTEEDPGYNATDSKSGVLCFEDCWPTKGDYDINDIVVAYQRDFHYNGYDLVSIDETYTFLNNGANYANGFGYQLTGLKTSDIKRNAVTSTHKCDGQGLDKSMADATVMLFDNGKSIGKGTTFKVYTSFSGNVTLLNINPFIVVRGGDYSNKGDILSEGRTEVHLPTAAKSTQLNRYFPTTKANTSYWGKEDDQSNPGSKIYYVRAGNYPFALDLYWDSAKYGEIKFTVPAEQKSIEQTYPEFTDWVVSGGKRNADWYYHPNEK